MIELVNKCVREPEENHELFYFIEDALLHLDEASPRVAANFPLFFALHLAVFFGFRINDEYTEEQHYLDLQEGVYVAEQPRHPYYLEGAEAEAVSYILKVQHPADLEDLPLNGEMRRRILNSLESFYIAHCRLWHYEDPAGASGAIRLDALLNNPFHSARSHPALSQEPVFPNVSTPERLLRLPWPR
jgi:hypothetical protein